MSRNVETAQVTRQTRIVFTSIGVLLLAMMLQGVSAQINVATVGSPVAVDHLGRQFFTENVTFNEHFDDQALDPGLNFNVTAADSGLITTAFVTTPLSPGLDANGNASTHAYERIYGSGAYTLFGINGWDGVQSPPSSELVEFDYFVPDDPDFEGISFFFCLVDEAATIQACETSQAGDVTLEIRLDFVDGGPPIGNASFAWTRAGIFQERVSINNVTALPQKGEWHKIAAGWTRTGGELMLFWQFNNAVGTLEIPSPGGPTLNRDFKFYHRLRNQSITGDFSTFNDNLIFYEGGWDIERVLSNFDPIPTAPDPTTAIITTMVNGLVTFIQVIIVVIVVGVVVKLASGLFNIATTFRGIFRS